MPRQRIRSRPAICVTDCTALTGTSSQLPSAVYVPPLESFTHTPVPASITATSWLAFNLLDISHVYIHDGNPSAVGGGKRAGGAAVATDLADEVCAVFLLVRTCGGCFPFPSHLHASDCALPKGKRMHSQRSVRPMGRKQCATVSRCRVHGTASMRDVQVPKGGIPLCCLPAKQHSRGPARHSRFVGGLGETVVRVGVQEPISASATVWTLLLRSPGSNGVQ